jgi:hypothetical protein
VTTVVHVAASRMSHEDEVEDGRIDVTDCIESSTPILSFS